MMLRRFLAPLLCLLGIAGLAALPGAPVLGAATPGHPADQHAGWVFETSDVRPDPAWRFGRLPNGMRYILRHNAMPQGEVVVRMQIDTGSLDETDTTRGYAHFVEHMAFQGSTHVREGEMVRLLERSGLAFGADTNAFTSFETTTYHLDLPNNTPALLDTALMLMRETATELTFAPTAVARERGVILAERRDRDTWQYRETLDRFAFTDPAAYYTRRMPIGTDETLNAATAQSLRAFWHRHYVPGNTTLIMVGDIDVAGTEAAIRAKFRDWAPAPVPRHPDAGPIDPGDAGRTGVYIDSALSEHLSITRRAPWRDEPDTWAARHEALLRNVGLGIINRRFQRMARRPSPPFRAASFGASDLFHAGRETALHIDSVDGQWRTALSAATAELRRALEQGVTQAEITEQFTNLRATTEATAARADTLPSAGLAQSALNLLRNDAIPSSPSEGLAWLRAQESSLTPEAVLAAVRRYTRSLDDPLIRFTGRQPPQGGAQALRAAWNAAAGAPLPAASQATPMAFAYTDFGPAGRVVDDKREAALGIREIRFANGVRLNIKHTDLVHDQVMVSLALDGGRMLATRDNPLAVEMVGAMATGGLGKHSLDDLQTLTAGRMVSLGMGAGAETFNAASATRPGDLLLQLQLMAAMITDPGYRLEAEAIFHQDANTMFTRLRATPGAALQSGIGGLLSDGDPRFTLQPVGAYRTRTFARLKQDIADRLAHGAIEIGIVGDVGEEEAIAAVAATLGALPPREEDFRPYADQRQRSFTARRGEQQLTHTGPRDQALIEMVWPTRDNSDPQEKQVLNLLQRVMHIQLTENLRQRLGRSYSPSASSEPSRIWPGYGTFSIAASVDVASLPLARRVMGETLAALRDHAPSDDVILRARAPLLESIDNALKTNSGWLGLVDRAQTRPDEIDRHLRARERLLAVTAAQVQAEARRYLRDEAVVAITVEPEPAGTAAAKAPSTATAPATGTPASKDPQKI